MTIVLEGYSVWVSRSTEVCVLYDSCIQDKILLENILKILSILEEINQSGHKNNSQLTSFTLDKFL